MMYQISRKRAAATKEQCRPPEKQSVLNHLREIQERNNQKLCFFKTIPHTITAAKKTKIRYHRFSKQNPLFSINRYPQEAGKISPILSKKSGRNSMGNIIPESIIEGKNTNCAIIVSFA